MIDTDCWKCCIKDTASLLLVEIKKNPHHCLYTSSSFLTYERKGLALQSCILLSSLLSSSLPLAGESFHTLPLHRYIICCAHSLTHALASLQDKTANARRATAKARRITPLQMRAAIQMLMTVATRLVCTILDVTLSVLLVGPTASTRVLS